MSAELYRFETGGVLNEFEQNENLANAEASSAYLDGWRVIEGMEVTAGAGLSVDIGVGSAHVGRNITFVEEQNKTGIPNNTTRYLWLIGATQTQNEEDAYEDTLGLFTWTETAVNPGQPAALLAEVTAAGGAITNVDESVRDWAGRWISRTEYAYGPPDAPDLYIDVENHRIGIGTASPDYALDIAKADDSGVLRADGVIMPAVAATPDAVTGHAQIYSKSDGETYALDPADNEIQLTKDGVIGPVTLDSLETAETDTNYFMRPDGAGKFELVQHNFNYFPKLRVVAHTAAATIIAPPPIEDPA